MLCAIRSKNAQVESRRNSVAFTIQRQNRKATPAASPLCQSKVPQLNLTIFLHS